MSNDIDTEFTDDGDDEQPITRQQVDEKKRRIKEQIELRQIAKELGLSVEDYLEAFGE